MSHQSYTHHHQLHVQEYACVQPGLKRTFNPADEARSSKASAAEEYFNKTTIVVKDSKNFAIEP